MNPGAHEFRPRTGPIGSTPASAPTPVAPKKVSPVAAAPQPDGENSSLRASAKVFVPGGAATGGGKPPLPVASQNQGIPPPPPPGPPPPGSPTLHSPTGQAPPSYNQSAGSFPASPTGNHVDPYGENSLLSVEAKAFTPGSGTPVEMDSPHKSESWSKETPAGLEGDDESTTTPVSQSQSQSDNNSTIPADVDPATPTAAGGSPLKVLTINPATPAKVMVDPFANSNLPVPETANEAVSPAPQLNGSWSLFVDEHAITIGANMQQAFHDPVSMATINCVENFWRLWKHVPAPSTRTPSFTYYWFRKDVKPNWEDPRNKNGGTINITLYDRDRIGIQDKAVVDDAWMAAVLLCTGESVAEASCINGVSLKIRNRFIMMQIWTNLVSKKELAAIADSLRTGLKSYCSDGSLAEGKMDFFTHQQVIKSVTTAAPKPKKGKGGAVKAAVREPDFQF